MAGGISVGCAMAISHFIPTIHGKTSLQNLARLIELPLVTAIIYVPLIRLMAPEAWNQVQQRLGPMLRRKFGAGRTAA